MLVLPNFAAANHSSSTILLVCQFPSAPSAACRLWPACLPQRWRWWASRRTGSCCGRCARPAPPHRPKTPRRPCSRSAPVHQGNAAAACAFCLYYRIMASMGQHRELHLLNSPTVPAGAGARHAAPDEPPRRPRAAGPPACVRPAARPGEHSRSDTSSQPTGDNATLLVMSTAYRSNPLPTAAMHTLSMSHDKPTFLSRPATGSAAARGAGQHTGAGPNANASADMFGL